ncbi:MAG: chemotaxis protein CheD [Haloplanus sp.]
MKRQHPARKVGIGELAVSADGTPLQTMGVGSCLGVALYDADAGVGGLVHVMLPEADADPANPRRFTDTGIRELVTAVTDAGADRESLAAKVAGGSRMFDFSGESGHVGERNAAVARRTLDDAGIPIAGIDVGGDYGRSLRFDPETGVLVVDGVDAGRTEI